MIITVVVVVVKTKLKQKRENSTENRMKNAKRLLFCCFVIDDRFHHFPLLIPFPQSFQRRFIFQCVMNGSPHKSMHIEDDGSLSGHHMRSHAHNGGNQYSKTRSPGSWHFEELTETSLLGAHFAQAVSIISHGDFDKILDANKQVPQRHMAIADKRFNPHLEYIHISHDCEAHFAEQEKAWRKGGPIFSRGDRKCTVPIPKVFVKKGDDPDHGIKIFGRQREIRPFSRIKRLHTSGMKHDTVRKKAIDGFCFYLL